MGKLGKSQQTWVLDTVLSLARVGPSCPCLGSGKYTSNVRGRRDFGFQLIQPLTSGRGQQDICGLEHRVAKLYIHTAHGAYFCELAARVDLYFIFQLPLKHFPGTIVSSSIDTF